MENNASSGKLTDTNNITDRLEWIEPKDFEYPISDFERFKRRMIRNPLVPLGFFATVAALTVGLRSLLRGDTKKSQVMMRWRVGLQAATIGALIGGFLLQKLNQDKEKD